MMFFGIHDEIGRIESLLSHSLELMKKADELPLIRLNIVFMHDLLSCHLHTLTSSHHHILTPVLTYKYIHIHTLPHNSNFHTHTHIPVHFSLITPSLPSHTHLTPSQFEMHVKHSSLRPDMKSDLTPSLFPLLTPSH